MSKAKYKQFLKNHKVTSGLSSSQIDLLASDLVIAHKGGMGRIACTFRPGDSSCKVHNH